MAEITFMQARYGILCGGLSVAISFALYFVDTLTMLLWSKPISHLILLGGMIIANRRYISKGNDLTFGQAFKAAWLIFIIGSTMLYLYHFILIEYLEPELKTIQNSLAITLSGKEVDIVDQNSSVEERSSILYPLVLGYIFPGAFLAAIAGFITANNRRPQFPLKS